VPQSKARHVWLKTVQQQIGHCLSAALIGGALIDGVSIGGALIDGVSIDGA
jgi:uncharacterized membrane-anchored protein YitT (DUF2179 family)